MQGAESKQETQLHSLSVFQHPARQVSTVPAFRNRIRKDCRMNSRGSLYPFLKLVVVIAFTIAGAACTSSGISSTPLLTPTPTVIAPTATPTPTPAVGPSPTATPIAAGFSLTPGQMAAMGRSSYAEAE